MAIHIDIYAHLRKQELIKEGEQLKRYVESLEKDANVRLKKGAEGRSKVLIKANDNAAASYDSLINASDAYVAATKRHGKALELLDALDKKVIRDEKELEKHLELVAYAEQEVTSSMRERTYTAQQLTKAVNTQTRATRDLNEENQTHTKRLRQVNTLVGKNKKQFRDLTRVTNLQRRELESLHDAHATVVKDNAGLARQLDRVSTATRKTREERKKYNEMVKEGTATYKQYREQTERVRTAHEAERKAIGDTRTALDGLIHSFDQHNVVVDANRTSLREFSRTALDTRKQMEAMHATHLSVIRDNVSLSRSFAAVGDLTGKAFREHQKYNKMVGDSSVSQDELRRQLDRTTDAYSRQARESHNATEGLRRHQRQEQVAAARRVAGTGGGGGGGGGGGHLRFDPGRWAARNLGALTPLGMVTPTLVLPLGTAFTQVANAAVAASQSIALLPAVVTAAGAAFGTLQLATAGFGDTVKALMEGDLEKFAETIQKLSPAAQQTALTFQHLAPELTKIQQAAQEAFFTGAPQMAFSLTKMLGPVIEDMTTSIATSMNKMMMGIGDMLLTPEGMNDVEAITQNISEAFQALEPAVTAVAHAFLDLTTVGSSFLPIMADDITEVAKEFAKFISEARDSGALRDFMYQGWEAIKAVGGAIKGFGKMLYDVFGLKNQQDVQEFRDTMQEMTDVLEVLFRTMKTVFEDIASVFTDLAGLFSIFGADLSDTSDILAGMAELWLFAYGIKWAKDFLSVIKEIKATMAGMAGLSALNGAAGAVGGGAGAAVAGSAAARGAGAASMAEFAGALGGLAGPITIATGAIIGLGAAAIWATHKISMTDFQEQTTPNIPGTSTPKPGLIPGTGGIPFPQMTPDEEARIKVMTGGKDPHSIPIEQLYKMLGRPVPAPSPAATGGPGLGSSIPTGTPGPVPWFDVPPMPVKPGDFQSTPGTFEMSNIPVGQFGGAQWNVPPGMMDLPPDYQNLGKTGFYQPDQFKIFQEQNQLDAAKVRVEEQRIAYLAKQADANATQDDINKAANDVIQAEQAWLESVRGLKEAERGEFVDLTGQMNSFSDDLRDSLGDLGAALDPDLGISKGLAGMAENLVKFVATLGAAPVLGAMKGKQAALGFPGNKGVGSGIVGMIAAQHGYYESPYSSEDQAQWQLGQQYGIVNPTLNGPVPANTAGRPTGGLPAGTTTNSTGSVAQQIIALAQQASGTKYDWGGSDLASGLSDCSGAVSDLVEIITKGRADKGRLFNAGPNTREDLANLGAVEGAIPGALQIGWRSGGPGGGHMRATLPNGVPFESGGGTGQGATYGGAAQGAQGMPNIMSIPIPGGGSVSVATPPGAAPAAAPAAVPPAATPPGLYSPENTNPALTNPKPPGSVPLPAGVSPAVAKILQGMPGYGFATGGVVGGDEGGLTYPDRADLFHHRTVRGDFNRGTYGYTGQFNPGMQLDTSTTATSPYLSPREAVQRYGDRMQRQSDFWFPYQDMTGVTDWMVNNGWATAAGNRQPPGPTDTVPAMLTPGELVIPKDMAPSVGQMLGFAGFSGGGKVGGGFIIPPGIGDVGKPAAPSGTNPLDSFAPTKPPVETPPWSGIPPMPGPPAPPPPGAAPGPEAPPQLPGVPPGAGVPGVPPGAAPPGLPGAPPIPGVPAPAGVPTAGSTIGAAVAPPEGYGEGAKFNGGGVIGAAIGAGEGAASAMPGMGAAASAALQIGIQEVQRAIEFGAQAAGIGVQGLMETFLPTGASELAQNSWFTRIAGGIAGAAPALPNLAGGLAEKELGKGANLPGVGPSTPEQIAAQALDPNRAEHTGLGPAPGPTNNTGVNIENYITTDNRAASQDFGRYAIPGQR